MTKSYSRLRLKCRQILRWPITAQRSLDPVSGPDCDDHVKSDPDCDNDVKSDPDCDDDVKSDPD